MIDGNPYNADFCKQTARLLMEISRFADSAKVLEVVVAHMEENVEAWYLLAYAHFSAGNYAGAQECLKNVSDLMMKPELKDQEIEEASAELEAKLKELDAAGVQQMEKGDEDEDEEDEEGEKEEKMEDK